jgi:uncharacterized protein YfcZ (UPF0381/DUF406 family)
MDSNVGQFFEGILGANQQQIINLVLVILAITMVFVVRGFIAFINKSSETQREQSKVTVQALDNQASTTQQFMTLLGNMNTYMNTQSSHMEQQVKVLREQEDAISTMKQVFSQRMLDLEDATREFNDKTSTKIEQTGAAIKLDLNPISENVELTLQLVHKLKTEYNESIEQRVEVLKLVREMRDLLVSNTELVTMLRDKLSEVRDNEVKKKPDNEESVI